MTSMRFFNVACERRDFRCAPEIRHIDMCTISPGRPWPGNRLLKRVFRQPVSSTSTACPTVTCASWGRRTRWGRTFKSMTRRTTSRHCGRPGITRSASPTVRTRGSRHRERGSGTRSTRSSSSGGRSRRFQSTTDSDRRGGGRSGREVQNIPRTQRRQAAQHEYRVCSPARAMRKMGCAAFAEQANAGVRPSRPTRAGA